MIEENFMRATPTKTLSWAVVEQVDHVVDLLLRQGFKTPAFGEELPKQAVGVFVRSSLSRCMRVGKVYLGMQLFAEHFMFGKFFAVICGESERWELFHGSRRCFHESFACAISEQYGNFKSRFPVGVRCQIACLFCAVNSIAFPVADFQAFIRFLRALGNTVRRLKLSGSLLLSWLMIRLCAKANPHFLGKQPPLVSPINRTGANLNRTLFQL